MQIPKWFYTDARTAVVGLVVVSGIGAIWTAIGKYGVAAHVAVPVVITVAALVLACIALAWNQLSEIGARQRVKKNVLKTSKEIEEQAWEWLRKNQFAVQSEPAASLEFRLNADNSVKVPVTIYRETGSPWVMFASKMTISPEHRPIVRRDAPLFKWDIGLVLLQLGGVQYEMVEDGAEISAVAVSQPMIFDESLDELTFLKTVMLVRRGAMIVAGVVNRIAEQSKLPRAQQSLPASTHDPKRQQP